MRLLTLCTLQLILRGRDGGNPSLETPDLPVTVLVERNRFPPRFVGDPYERVVDPSVDTNTVLLTVSARDDDISVCKLTHVHVLIWIKQKLKSHRIEIKILGPVKDFFSCEVHTVFMQSWCTALQDWLCGSWRELLEPLHTIFLPAIK